MRRVLLRQRSPARLAVAGGLVLALTVVLAASGAIVPSRPALGASTTISVIAGSVEVRHGDVPYAAAIEGEVIAIGDAVRTGDDGRAVLTYFDGSTVEIEPSSELVIEQATIGADGSTAIEMTQVFGHTWHVVERQLSPGSKYEVHTSSATATVRGTTFEVLVANDEDGVPATTILTAKGSVALRRSATFGSAGEEVLVPAGRQGTARSGRRIDPPEPRPEPERVVTVTVGSENSIVVDPLGRANGLRDGKLVLETPGASVETVDGKLVITLPNIPDGRLNAEVRRGASGEDVAVETRVRERGRGEERAEERAFVPPGGRADLELQLRRGERPELRTRGDDATPTPTPTSTLPPRVPFPTVPPFASPSDRGGGAPARTAAPQRTSRPRATGAPAVQISALPTFPPREHGPPAAPLASPTDRGQDRGSGQERGNSQERENSDRHEPSRIVPNFRLPELPVGGSSKSR